MTRWIGVRAGDRISDDGCLRWDTITSKHWPCRQNVITATLGMVSDGGCIFCLGLSDDEASHVLLRWDQQQNCAWVQWRRHKIRNVWLQSDRIMNGVDVTFPTGTSTMSHDTQEQLVGDIRNRVLRLRSILDHLDVCLLRSTELLSRIPHLPTLGVLACFIHSSLPFRPVTLWL
jgi:hypothetical protein